MGSLAYVPIVFKVGVIITSTLDRDSFNRYTTSLNDQKLSFVGLTFYSILYVDEILII